MEFLRFLIFLAGASVFIYCWFGIWITLYRFHKDPRISHKWTWGLAKSEALKYRQRLAILFAVAMAAGLVTVLLLEVTE